MKLTTRKDVYYPINYPMNFSGELTAKIVINDFVRADQTSALYLQVFINSERKKIPLAINVRQVEFDKKKQKVNRLNPFYKDYNLIIEKAFADINKIEISYRLAGEFLSMEKFMFEYKNPSARIDFIRFWELELENQKMRVKKSTLAQQTSSFKKLKKYRSSILFYEIDLSFYEKMIFHFKNVERNAPHTLRSLAKNFKKYLGIAHELGMKTPLKLKEIKTPMPTSNRVFLMPSEVYKLYEYYNSSLINNSLKNILSRFLFSCFTGLRFGDIKKISIDNIAHDVLIFFAEKTEKLQRIKLTESALIFISSDYLFKGEYSDQHINGELKVIAKACGIKKNITFHVARHTFATNYLLCGGKVQDLQKLLGHSDIKETMIYVHIVDSITDQQIDNMNDILKKRD